MNQPPQPPAVLDADNDTITVAITFKAGYLSIDKCDVGSFLGEMRRALVAWLTQPDGYGAPDSSDGVSRRITGLSYTCWDPAEEFDLGYIADYDHPTCAGCGRAVRPVDPRERWRAPELYEHVVPIDGDEPCDRLSGRYDGPDPYVINFPNRLAIDLTTNDSQW